jgi:hypothetical protein
MVSLLLIDLLMAGCAAPVPLAAPEPEAVVVEEEKEVKPRRAVVKPPAPVIVIVPVPTIAKPLPPCESAPGDKKTAILQKLECLKQTADIPIPSKP